MQSFRWNIIVFTSETSDMQLTVAVIALAVNVQPHLVAKASLYNLPPTQMKILVQG